MPKQPARLALSPSEFHLRLMRDTKPDMAYSGGDVAAWQKPLRRKIAQLTGFDGMPKPGARVPLKPRTLWRREHKLGTIEKITFAAEPGADVLAYLCLPRNAKPPYPTMICLQGHSTGMHVSIAVQREDETKPFNVEGDRDHGLRSMKNGFAALCIEQRSFGERREQQQKQLSPHPCHDAVMHALMLGRTLVGERVFDVDRGIDYLATRGDIDMKRVGVMGNSGGGTATIFSAALLHRLAFAMPSCAVCSFAESIMRIYHCGDNYVPGILRHAEAGDVVGLFAPRPLVVVAGKRDDIFPIHGTHEAFRTVRKIYSAAGAGDRCKLVIGGGGHRFYARPAWKALRAVLEF